MASSPAGRRHRATLLLLCLAALTNLLLRPGRVADVRAVVCNIFSPPARDGGGAGAGALGAGDAFGAADREDKREQTTAASLSFALANTPIGSLGPKNTARLHFRYYDSLFYTAMQFGKEAKSTIEVGCATDPFLKYLSWIDKKVCVAPYFTGYGKQPSEITRGKHEEQIIESVVVDFMEYQLPNNNTYKFDLLICSQVVEHVDKPKAFVQKLIASAKTSIISVPYKWHKCGEKCGHKTHGISYEHILEWSHPYVPILSMIVKENSGFMLRRIIVVFETT